jgi:hypothetical protein
MAASLADVAIRMSDQPGLLWITATYPQQRSSSLQPVGNAHTVERLDHRPDITREDHSA